MNKINRVCPTCGEVKNKLLFTDHNRREGYLELVADYVECTSCSMKYLTNVPDFNSFVDTYEDIYVKPDIKKLKSKLKTNITENGLKVLDIGCNHGIELIKYKNKGYEIYGIDLNKKAVNDCKKYLPKDNFFTTTIENTEFAEGFFDIITTSHVLEHVYEIDSFIKSVHKLLKKGGKFVIKVPNANSLEMIVWGKYASQSWVPFHINMFDNKTIKLLLENKGFDNINIRTNPFPWWWILSYRQWAGTINKEKGVTNFDQNIFHIILQIILFPILWIISRLGYGEELEINAIKNDNN